MKWVNAKGRMTNRSIKFVEKTGRFKSGMVVLNK
jgi:hypothetical protein